MKQNSVIQLCKVEFKKCVKTIVFMIVIGLLCYIVPLLSMNKDAKETNIGVWIALVVGSCYIIPIIQNSYKMNKRKIDRVYALPISKRTLVHVKFITGLLEIIISYTIIYWFGFLLVAIKQPHFVLQYYVPLYGVVCLFVILIYTFYYFISSRANTIFDAILLVILWTSVFIVIANLVYMSAECFANMRSTTFVVKNKIDRECIPFYPFIEFGNFYNNWILSKTIPYSVELYTSDQLFANVNLFYIVFYPILGVVSYLGIFFFSSKDKGEYAEEITNGIFGYQPLMILYLFFITVSSVNQIKTQYVLLAIGIAVYLILDVIHKRRFKIDKRTFLIMGITLLAGIGCGFVFHIFLS